MNEPIITPEDDARHMQIMADYDALFAANRCVPVPMCHFKPMTQHWDDSHPASDDHWYECEHCGHTEDSAKAWAKVKATEATKAQPACVPNSVPVTDNALF